MKQKLIILSDLWGVERSKWLCNYTDPLNARYDIKVYDSCILAEINTNLENEELRHREFVNGGLGMAVKNLLKFEKEECDVLAFSIGGAIAWKAALGGLKINKFYGVSATRLRLETEKPDCKIRIFFGEKDDHKPTPGWFQKLELAPEIFEHADHQLYMRKKFSAQICETIFRSTTNFCAG